MHWAMATDYWLARLVFQRALALVYLLAFVCAGNQFRALIGEHGLLPVPQFTRAVGFKRAPSVFGLHYSDRFFAAVGWGGAVVSAALLAGAGDVMPAWAAMAVWALIWLAYLSIVNVGQLWYGFGWESLLLETGFLAIFLGSAHTAPPTLVLWLLRWLLFRVEFGAGLIKMRGDRCWRDLTCLYYHHETQPMPGPLSWYFHHLPKPLHRVETAANHFAQLVVPFALFAPQPVASMAAGIVIVTQLWLMTSGNFAWLNAITIVLALGVLDDSVWGHVLGYVRHPAHVGLPHWLFGAQLGFAVLVIVLSYWPVANMLSRHQVMNTSFNRLHLVNSYGAFGTVTRLRHEIVIEGTGDLVPGPDAEWREYEFKGKPGDPKRRPPQFAPYHLRLDWYMWFASLSPDYARSWFVPLLHRLLAGDETTLRLLRHNPFPDAPPAFVRALLYRYRFTGRAERRTTGAWWHRELVGEFVPPLRGEDIYAG